MSGDELSRRRMLRLAGGAGAVVSLGLAGCSGNDGGSTETDTSSTETFTDLQSDAGAVPAAGGGSDETTTENETTAETETTDS